jgi:hypothetical protein
MPIAPEQKNILQEHAKTLQYTGINPTLYGVL